MSELRELLDNGTGTNTSAENSDRDFPNAKGGSKRIGGQLEKNITKRSARLSFFLVQ